MVLGHAKHLPGGILILLLMLVAAPVLAADAPATAPASATPADKPPLKPEELEQLLAPLALYPDALLTQVLMASTYPLEIVQADRWAKEHKDLKGDALGTELDKQEWDASVKSMVNFPDVLALMSDKLDLTIKIGDAFIEQQADVLNTVQKLRAKAQSAGNLKGDQQVKIVVEAAPPATQPSTVVVQQVAPPPQIIKIESSSPDVIYVPTYNPTVVYGSWPYPAYPPYPYYPPTGGTQAPADPAQASLKYYKAICAILDNATAGKSAMDSATWIRGASKRIDQLPILNVDPALVEWGSLVSSRLKQVGAVAAVGQTQINSRVAGVADPQYSSYSYDSNGYYTEGTSRVDRENANKQRRQAALEQKAQGQQQAVQILNEIAETRPKIRAEMVAKYKIEF